MHHFQLTVLPGWLLLFGLSTASPTQSLSERDILDFVNASSRRWNIEFDGPKGNWVGLGDSFSAGPGAGNQIDGPCKRNDKGYPAQLQDDWPNGDAHTLKFISCSGAKIPDTIEKQLPQIDSSLQYATLSISGNDIGFSKILQSCIAGFPWARDCDTLLAEARTKLYSQDLFDGYQQVVDGILLHSGWQAAGANRVMIYQTSYPAFFDALTPQCSTITFNPLIDTSPLLTTAVRSKMNSIQAELNTMIAFWIANVNAKYSNTFSPIIYVDQDEDYTQHRFCNKDTTEPDSDNSNCWFFPLRGAGNPPAISDYAAIDPNTCEAEAGDDFQSLWICGMVRQKQKNPDFDLTKTVPFEWIAKIFHPTIPGHTAVAKAVKSAMAYELYYPPGVRNLNILPVGDSITVGLQSSDGVGYRRVLTDLLKDSLYNIEWSGTQDDAGGYFLHEGYIGVTIRELQNRLLYNRALTNFCYKLNLVLLMIGTTDIDQGTPPIVAVTSLRDLILLIFDRCPDVMILIGNLIPLGASKTPIFPLDSKQRAVMEYNSRIRDLVNQGRTDGQRIAVVHSSVDQYSRADDLLPNDKGYEKMGHDWFEAIQRVNKKGLIKDTPPGTADGPCVPPGDRFNSSLVLRITPLGASIVVGYGSTDKNGFREDLREKLTGNGAPVNYVGSIKSGNMLDNDVEAVGGFRIDQVATQVEKAFPFLPNVVLMHFGSNDAVQDYDVAHAHERLGALIDRVFSAIPGVTVVVSTLIPSLDATVESRIQVINSNIPAMVQSRVDQGKKVQLVDMHDGLITAADHFDSLHPNDAGYAKIAGKFYEGIQQAYGKCWITTPGFVAGLNDTVGDGEGTKNTVCEKIPGNTVGPIQTQQGSGVDDGIYIHKGVVFGEVDVGFPNGLEMSPAGVRWADINGDGLDDFVYIQDGPDNIAQLIVVLNDGLHFTVNTSTVRYSYSQAPGACKAEGMQLEDFDGDGRDDLFCIGLDAKLYVWINTPGKLEETPNWVSAGMVIVPAGYTRSQMRLGDIDGDGRVDYIGISDTNEIVAWRHAGIGVAATSWEDMGIMIHAGSIAGDPAGFRFEDINGDGRDDLLWVSTSGQVDTWINLRGQTRSHQPKWLASGRTHAGGNGITARNQVRFGKLTNHFPAPATPYPDYQGMGADYTQVPGGSKNIQLTVNNGNGGTRQKADGSRYCDMRGTGSDDYIWISRTGELQLYGNSHNPPNWIQYGIIYTPPASLMKEHFRKDIHLADMSGDGKCDFVIADRTTGNLYIVQNNYDAATDKFAWKDPGKWSSVNCNQRYGPGLFDLAVRLADLNGDGRADYLCIAVDGSATGYLNIADANQPSGVGFTFVGQVKHDEGKDRANIRFYDVTGDGRADYIWLSRVTGAFSYWTNDGYIGLPQNSGDSAFHWTARGVAGGGGSLRGECINFADLNGDGRADYMDVYPDTNIAYVYYNLCPGGSV